jgi:uncharacterized protein (TIGR02099 family)
LVGRIDRLTLQPLALIAGFAAEDRLPGPLAALLRAGVDGHARDIAFRIAPSADVAFDMDWSLSAGLRGFGIAGSGPIPELRGVSVDFSASPRGGSAHLRGSDARLDLRPHLVEPLTLTALDGALGWRWMPAGSLHLWSDALQVDTGDLQSVTRFSLCAHPSGASPFLDVHTFFRNGDAEAMGRYLPVSIMHDALEDWLNRAVVGGRVDSGDVLLRGRLDAFPFDGNEGRFLLVLRVLDGILDYRPPRPAPSGDGLRSASPAQAQARALGWPRLEELDLTLRLENRRMTIDVERGKLLDTELLGGSVLLPDLWNPRRLAIDARGEGPLSDGLRVLAETPLSAKLGGIAQAFRVDGRGDIKLELGVPLRRGLDFTYAGELRLDGEQSAELAGVGLQFDAIEGMLAFDNAGLRARGLTADLDGQRILVDVATRDGGTERARTEVGIDGVTAVDELRRRFPSPLWASAEGRIDWRVLLSLNNADVERAAPPLDLTFTSDLEGLAVDLPAPLGKTAGETRALTLSTRWQNAWPLLLRGRYGDPGALVELDSGNGGVPVASRVALDPGGLPEKLPERRGVVVGGTLASLDLTPWLDWFSGRFAGPAEAPADPSGADGDTGSAPGSSAPALLPSRLEVADLRLGALTLRDAVANVSRADDGGWAVRFSSEAMSGSIDLPAPGVDRPVAVRLDSLDIQPLIPTRPAVAREPAQGDPRRFGRLRLAVDALRYGNDDLGRLQLTARPIAGGMRIEDLTLDGALVDADGSLDWTVDATDYMQTGLDLRVSSSDVGELLRKLGHYSQLSGAPSDARLALTWPGAPDDFSARRARGSLQVDVGAGRLLELDAGVGRLLGVLNIGALQRRLSLDFSDVFEEGFSFDRIEGRLAIGGGTARIGSLDILASAADIRVTGVTNLVDETFDQTVRVTPKIGTGVALASAVAGGPLVGAAVFIADKVAGDAVDRIGRYEYSINGPWNEPEIRRTASADGAWSVGDLFAGDAADGAGEPRAGSAAADGGADRGVDAGASGRPAASETAPSPAGNPFMEGF